MLLRYQQKIDTPNIICLSMSHIASDDNRKPGLTPLAHKAPVVWIINHYAQEPGGAGGTRHFSLALALKKQGYAPYIIAASTVHNQMKQRLDSSQSLRLDIIDTVPFLWLKTSPFKGNGLSRLFNMLRFGFCVGSKKILAQIPKPDVVIGSSPDPFAALGAARAAAKYSAPFIYEIRDLWPLSLIELKKLHPLHPLAILMSAIERFLIFRARRIIVVQAQCHRYLVPRGANTSHIAYLPNGIDIALFPEQPEKPQAPHFTFMYFGAHGNGNGLDTLLYAQQKIEQSGSSIASRLRLIGDGPLKPSLMALAESLALKHISFEPPIAKRDIPALAAQADALIFHVADLPVLRYGISANKLFDYLAAARPVIFACNAPNNPVADAQAGLSIPAGDADALADAMRTLYALPVEERAAMGARGRTYVSQTHSIEACGEKLADMLHEILLSPL